jgi:quercetin dioxygenase-like cupin family protein
MQIVRLADGRPYDAPRHSGVHSWRIQGGDASAASFCSVGVSRYAPGGSAEMDAGPQEKIYVVLSGEISVTLASGEQSALRAYDSCLIAANEMREVRNTSDADALLLVITPNSTVGGASASDR